ncbi:hypothetical protein P12x_005269 [Tundrisphaera lichenicola]|uniref:hypothetical protein n=1 Tax=Tundrisphaera lichenicola TaxID=2029860 RepID=UPI003EBD6EE6
MEQEAKAKDPWKGVPRKKIIDEVYRLRDAVRRLIPQSPAPSLPVVAGRGDDSVPTGWAERHGITIPRAEGVFESVAAWVRVKNGVIIGAGLKNQSILSLAISLDLLDQGAEHHGNLYRDWRAAFLSRLDPATSGDAGSDGSEAWTKEDRYSKLIHRVEKDYLNAMDCIVASRPKAKHLAAFQANQEAFVEAFKIVAKAMVEINHEAEQAQHA